MKEKINPFEYSGKILSALKPGILLNTYDEKFNSMVIGWGHMGIIWNQPTFTVYVRQSRYTKPALENTGVFTVSAPLEGGLSPEVMKVCGSQSGRDVDKASLFTLEPAETNNVPGVAEYPLTLECEVLYGRGQDLKRMPPQVLNAFYGGNPDEEDFHSAYIGLIKDAYIIK